MRSVPQSPVKPYVRSDFLKEYCVPVGWSHGVTLSSTGRPPSLQGLQDRRGRVGGRGGAAPAPPPHTQVLV